MTTQLIVRLSQTGFLPNGEASNTPVLINDLDVGAEFQLRKERVYVPLSGHIDILATGRVLGSLANGVIAGYVTSGVLNADLFVQPPSFDNAHRPSATNYPIGTAIWNTDDNALNWSDGTDWRNAAGSVT